LVVATAILTIVSGLLYSWLGAKAFIAMSVLCLMALPIAFSLANALGPIHSEPEA
jgi:hypothetical protein